MCPSFFILALRRPNEPPVKTAEYNLDSSDPQRFLSYIKEITNYQTQSTG
jgi:hypothetical protein